MNILPKSGLLVLVPQDDEERASVAVWLATHADHAFHLQAVAGGGLRFADLGPKPEACRVPINVTSRTTDPATRFISNFAPTPFSLEGKDYACVEAFWQGLKFESEEERRQVASMNGRESKKTGDIKGYGICILYAGQTVRVGTWDHWQLMERACWEKFSTHPEAREALLSTGNRPLEHRMRRDSKTIPGVIMSEIWMRIRARLRKI